jgi:hypothetical protein
MMLLPSVYLSAAAAPYRGPTDPAVKRPRGNSRPAIGAEPRPAAVLLIVLVILTMFAVIGLAFMFYADSDAAAAIAYRDSMISTQFTQGDVDPEQAFAQFLAQLIYDCKDDPKGWTSALRGHSLMRTMYGQNYNAGTGLTGNGTPYNGTGRLHYTYPATAGVFAGADDYQLVNYTYFPVDALLRDPERLGTRAPGSKANAYSGGFNAPYTAADLNSMFLAAVTNTGTLLTPSYHRNWNGISLNPTDASYKYWASNTGAPAWIKYTTLRPRPADQLLSTTGLTPNGLPNFPLPEDAGGDVRNRPISWGLTGNDSVWIYTGAPVWTLPDGRQYTMLFAPLIIDLDSKLNLNVHGNLAGTGMAQAGNQGWEGPTGVNFSGVSFSGVNYPGVLTATDFQNLILGIPNTGATKRIVGRYGTNALPGATATSAVIFNPALSAAGGAIVPHFYAMVDFDGKQASGAPSTPWTMPAQPYQLWPVYPATAPIITFGNASAAELTSHPLLYNAVKGNTASPYHRVFTASDLEMLYRYGDLGTDAMYSDLAQLLTNGLTNPTTLHSITTRSYDRTAPGLVPWLTSAMIPSYKMAAYAQASPPGAINVVTGAPVLPSGVPGPIPFPNPTTLASAGGEFGPDGRGILAAVAKVDLNRLLPAYPAVNTTTQTFNLSSNTPGSFTSLNDLANYKTATQGRQQFATDILNVLRKVTGVYNPDNYVAANPPAAIDLQALRYLAQLAVNIVDFIDDDDIITPFPWTRFIGNAQFQAQYPNDFVFGTEIPKLVINEAYSQFSNDLTGDPGLNPPKAGTALVAQYYYVDTWVELCNPFMSDSTLLDGAGAARLYATPAPGSGYAVYQMLLTKKNLLMHAPENTSGMPDWATSYTAGMTPPVPGVTMPLSVQAGQPYNQVYGNPVASEWNTGAGTAADATVVLPLNGAFAAPNNQSGFGTTGQPVGFYMVGPVPFPTSPPGPPTGPPFPASQNPPKATVNSQSLRYKFTLPTSGSTVLPSATPPTIVLQRLLCPYAPPDPNPASATYNPYITVDDFANVKVNLAAGFTPGGTATGAPNQLPAINTRQSVGRLQPYSKTKILQSVTFPATQQPPTYTPNQPQHTFFQHNAPTPPTSGTQPPNTVYSGFWQQLLQPPGPGNLVPPSNFVPFNWLTHLDRPLISPMELLNVSAFRPHELTYAFNGTAFGQQAHWFDDTMRLYRFFEYAETHARQAGAFAHPKGLPPISPTSLTRVPGKININTIWDQQTFMALCDPRTPSTTPPGGNHFTPLEVQTIWNQLLTLRNPDTIGTGATAINVPGPNARPFWSLTAGYVDPNAKDTQYPNPKGFGIEDTLLRPFNPSLVTTITPPSPLPNTYQSRRLLQLDPTVHVTP